GVSDGATGEARGGGDGQPVDGQPFDPLLHLGQALGQLGAAQQLGHDLALGRGEHHLGLDRVGVAGVVVQQVAAPRTVGEDPDALPALELELVAHAHAGDRGLNDGRHETMMAALAVRCVTATGGRGSPYGDARRGYARGRSSRSATRRTPMSMTETGDITGTKDKDYDIIWFTEVCLSNVLRLETYIQDAERAGDGELAEFFRKAQAE